MTHPLRSLGLALAAVLALSAFAASAAQAFEFTTTTAPVKVTGQVHNGATGGKHVFTTGGGEVTCTTISFTGTSTVTASKEQTIEPSYSGCTAFGSPADIKMNGCDYLFTTPSVDAGGGKRTGAPPHIICPTGNRIEITPTFFGASVCTTFIKEQTPTGGHIIYINSGINNHREMDLTVETTVTGVGYTGTGGVCGHATETFNSSYNGWTTLRAYEDGQPHDAAHQVSLTIS